MATAPSAGTVRPLPIVLSALLVLALAALAAVAALTGRLPGTGGSAGAALALRTGPLPLLDCAGGATDGGVVEGGPVVAADGLRAAATAERDAAGTADDLVRLVGYRAGEDVVAVWSDAASRARLVLTYRRSGQGWVLVSRSGCV